MTQWKINGVVDKVDLKNNQITFWLDGFDELQTAPIVPAMPDWLLQPEIAFSTNISRTFLNQGSLVNNMSWGFFYPQDYAHLSEEDLLIKLREILI